MLWERMKGVEQFSSMNIQPNNLLNEQTLLSLLVQVRSSPGRVSVKSPVPESSGEGNQSRVGQAKSDTLWTGILCFLDPDPSASGLRVSSLPFGDFVHFILFDLI